MATEVVHPSEPVYTSKHSDIHPLSPINPSEIRQAASILKSQWPSETDFWFKTITLQEPIKAETVPYLEAEKYGGALPHIDRRAFLTYYLRNTVRMTLELDS